MKSLLSVFSIVMLTACAVADAQSADKPAAISDAQRGFDLMKTLAGNWQGPITTDNVLPGLRTSRCPSRCVLPRMGMR
jgi:hypothetical protein